MDLFTYLMAKNGNNTSVHGDLFSYLLGKGQSGEIKTIAGTTIYIPNAEKLVNFMLSKESTQETTRGVQLFDFDNCAYEAANAATATKNTDSYTVQNTTSQWGSVRFSQNDLQLKPNTTYTFSSKIVESTSGTSCVYVSLTMSSTGTEIWGNRVGAGETSYVTFTTPNEFVSTSFIGLYPRGENESATFGEIQIEEGSEVTSYEKYTGGIPAPNLEYPMPIETVKGYRNSYNKDNLIGGWIRGSDGQYFNQYTETYNCTDFIEVSSDTTYILNLVKINSLGSAGIIEYNSSKTYITYTPENEIVKTFTTGSTTKYIRFTVRVDSKDNVMLLEGNTLLPYVPYGNNYIAVNVSDGNTTNSYPIPLNNNEIVGIGDYKDKLIINKKGKVFINKKTAKIDNYNGETITTTYMSTTGGLNTGSTVYYCLNNPILINLNKIVDLRLFEGANTITNTVNGYMTIKYK